MEKDHDKLAQRIALILGYFNEGNALKVTALAEEFAVSERTIQKDLNERLSFLPIVKENGAYKLEPYALGKFTQKDLQYFAVFSGIHGLYPSLDQKMLADILNERVNYVLSVKGFEYEDISGKQTLFDLIGGQIVRSERVHFVYKEKPRLAEPYKLLNTNGIWYLIAVENGLLKTFTFSKIKQFERLNERFVSDSAVLERIRNYQGNWFGAQEIEVTLKIDSAVSEYFLRRDLLPWQKILEKQSDGLVVSSTVAYEEEILRVVRYWLPHIQIISPSSMKNKMIAELKNYLENNQSL